ncbi:hypothetical protein ACIHCM_37115 [Streptomyces sp. NPDC052023]|uniref:hypothetical protein n=1 Tax=Streptomyces sp. NPDC052023 TaxID=3365681 RepID=UPI0037CFD591
MTAEAGCNRPAPLRLDFSWRGAFSRTARGETVSRCPRPPPRVARALALAVRDLLVKRLLNGRGGGSPEVAQGGSVAFGQVTRTLAAVPGLVAGA